MCFPYTQWPTGTSWKATVVTFSSLFSDSSHRHYWDFKTGISIMISMLYCCQYTGLLKDGTR
jgi:hypothetical protein